MPSNQEGSSNRLALQLWTVRQGLQDAPEETLRRVREMGYQFVELAPLPESLSLARLCELLQSFDLKVASIHGDLPTAGYQAAMARCLEATDCRRLIWSGWPRDGRYESLQGLQRVLVDYLDAAEWARREGIELGLHNHWWEFEWLDGISPYRWVFDRLPETVFWQLDVYWAKVAGQDPLALVREWGDRIRSLHLKDGPAVHGVPMLPLGEGVVPIGSILDVAAASADWVVELDEFAGDPLVAAERSLQFLVARASRR